MAIINKESSSTQTSSAIIFTGACWYYGFTCATGGSNRTIAIYDNTSAAGTIVENFTADANKTVDGHSHAIPVSCKTGLYLSMSGGTVVVYFKPKGMA